VEGGEEGREGGREGGKKGGGWTLGVRQVYSRDTVILLHVTLIAY
jgi:hypothetical protein